MMKLLDAAGMARKFDATWITLWHEYRPGSPTFGNLTHFSSRKSPHGHARALGNVSVQILSSNTYVASGAIRALFSAE
jgi:hypothetical protein